jgi:Domain of unknown function (DUF6249)
MLTRERIIEVIMIDETLIPLFGIVFGISLPISIPIIGMILNYRKRRHLMQLHHIERMAAIERGIEVPPLPLEFIDGRAAGARRRRTSLLPGLVWFFIGLALLISVRTLAEQEALLGLIPTGIGLAYLVYYFIEGRKIEHEQIAHDMALERTAKPQRNSVAL